MASKPSARKVPAIVASHTHWDRAWYFPFEQFRHMLVQTIEQLLCAFATQKRFKKFNLDGQTVVLEDYLEIMPHRRAELARLIRAGRLVVGPFYTLPDEFLVSGEAIIRNLLIGRKITEEFGGQPNAGYSPDSFGHIAQLPAILRGCGVDSFIFSRGLPRAWTKGGSAFRWVSPDGQTWVMGLSELGFYNALMDLSRQRRAWGERPNSEGFSRGRAEAEVKKIEAAGHPGAMLLPNGHDHWPAEARVGEMLAMLNKTMPAYDFRHGSFADYADLVRPHAAQWPARQGEMHDGALAAILSGVFSTRMYLKQQNAYNQALLERLVEPLATAATLAGDPHPHGTLTYLWKTLLKNHPHDDICGCSVDATHQDNEDRTRRLRQAADFLCNRSLGWLVHTAPKPAAIPGPRLAIYNGLPRRRRVLVQAQIVTHDDQPRSFVLNERGQAQRAFAGPIRKEYRQVWDGQAKQVVKRLDAWHSLTFVADLPAMSLSQWALPPAGASLPKSSDKSGTLRAGKNWIENNLLKVTMAGDGSVTVRDKVTQRVLRNLNVLQDEADGGDEYDFSPLPKDKPITSTGLRGKVKAALPGRAYAEIFCAFNLKLPAKLEDSAPRRRSSGRVELAIRTTARLLPDSRRIEFTTEVNNTAQDHRLRVLFPSDVQTKQVQVAEHFQTLSRPVVMPPGDADDSQRPVQTQHAEEFVSLTDGRKGFSLLTRGLPEYQALPGRRGVQIALTLLRCVGWLSRDDLSTRRGHAGPGLATPQAQCLGRHVFQYALVLHAGAAQEAGVWAEAMAYTTPVHLMQIEAEEGAEAAPGASRAAAGLIELDDPCAVVSAVKMSKQGQVVVRLWNAGRKAARFRLRAGFDLAGACMADMLEQPLAKGRLACRGHAVTLPSLRPCAIATVLLGPAPEVQSAAEPLMQRLPEYSPGGAELA
ncbi:MAG: hypothetical protein IT443_04630 [Phycisphaeraceae bacterium]|nr:hypothetical protein [Phycisphaeraceae bacterium]